MVAPKFRWIRRLQKPWLTAATALFLLVSGWVVWSSTKRGECKLFDLVSERDPHTSDFRASFSALREAAGFEFYAQDNFARQAWEKFHAAEEERKIELQVAIVRGAVSGIYAPTEQRDRVYFDILYNAWGLGKDERLPPDFFLFLESTDNVQLKEIAAILRAEPNPPRTVLVMGYLHNAAAFSALCVFLVSLGWVPRSGQMYRQWRQRRAAKRGECPKCGYALAGLKSGVCPECGVAIEAHGDFTRPGQA